MSLVVWVEATPNFFPRVDVSRLGSHVEEEASIVLASLINIEDFTFLYEKQGMKVIQTRMPVNLSWVRRTSPVCAIEEDFPECDDSRKFLPFCRFQMQCCGVGLPPTIKLLTYFYKSQKKGEGDCLHFQKVKNVRPICKDLSRKGRGRLLLWRLLVVRLCSGRYPKFFQLHDGVVTHSRSIKMKRKLLTEGDHKRLQVDIDGVGSSGVGHNSIKLQMAVIMKEFSDKCLKYKEVRLANYRLELDLKHKGNTLFNLNSKVSFLEGELEGACTWLAAFYKLEQGALLTIHISFLMFELSFWNATRQLQFLNSLL
ncbi:uncharacterized protein G2W53_017550 [Senna tora]|uniref:Uncharacterized protein n=1 Tax=Senna tora TaxID=362788 RepID=A0A834WP29_9FABA|nr:uncharacterized protein G2W53_017550 [Senna tora]